MRINLIWAVSHNGVIGAEGDIPWHLPEDLARFKQLTSGCPVIMGRKTWESLPEKARPLPGRMNLVLTRQADWQAPGAIVAPNLEAALAQCQGAEDVWVIGGAQVYKEAMPLACRIEVTSVDIVVHGDTFAPAIKPVDWRLVDRKVCQSAKGIAYTLMTFRRKPRAA